MALQNVTDTTILSSLGFGWVMQIDWVFITGLIIGITTIVLRFLEWQQKKRTNDLKERELDERGG